MGMLQTFIVTVAAALVGGLVVIAVQHPARYRRIAPFLAIAVAAAFLLTTVYRMGGDSAYRAVDQLIREDKIVEAFHAVQAALPNMLWVLCGTAASLAYLTALWLLPWALGVGENGDRENNENEKR